MKGDGLCKVTRMMIGKREIRLDQGNERACRHACGRARGSKSGRYAHKTHYRIVFKEQGVTIDRIKSLPQVMQIFSETVGGAFLLVRPTYDL